MKHEATEGSRDWITPQELADSLDVTRSAIIKHLTRETGHIRGAKVVGQWRIPASERDRLLADYRALEPAPTRESA